MRKFRLLLAITLFFIVQAGAQEKIDAGMMQKIRDEGLKNSKVMDNAFHLTDASGARLTVSPGFMRAANWAKSQLTEWGLEGANLEPWGDFGKGWELQKSYLALTAPYYKPVIAFPKAWTAGTNGQQSAEIILIDVKDSTELSKYAGKLKGKIVILNRTDTLIPTYKADANRLTDDELQKMAEAKPTPPDTAAMRRRREQFMRQNGGAARTSALLKEMAQKEGSFAILSTSPRGHDGTLFVQGGGSYAVTAPENFTDLVIAYEDYMSIVRLLRAGIPVKADLDVKTRFTTDDTKGYNVIAEIKGTDKKLKDELVMLGGHLDSWHGAMGATDNAAGCAVMMEAVRILKALGVKPRRTIRIALWSGEEEGLFGSRNYVKNHFADPATMQLLPDHAKLSSYFNLDNGTGKIRGVYLQGNEACRSIFAQWLEPFKDLGASTITINNTGGTDHLSYDAVGLPGFQFIQDPIEYDTRTHHTNMDSYDHLSAEDLAQAATIVAAFVYDAAMRDEKLPRKELPEPRGNRPGF
ncbi:MAG: peptidase M28 [Bacteroidetes bacterium]|nr:MAG: peptidase M28 [Bacteroidota bacterium]